jgi:hypothetical protein
VVQRARFDLIEGFHNTWRTTDWVLCPWDSRTLHFCGMIPAGGGIRRWRRADGGSEGSGRPPRVVAGRIGEDGDEMPPPGFAPSETGAGRRTGLGRLDDVAAALPGLLANTRSR